MFEAIFLGILQGLTEFLPISSSAHIRIAGELFGTNQDPGATFTAITQIGTELAVLIYFRRDIVRIISAWFHQISRKDLQAAEKADARMGWLIIVGTLPIVALGYLGQERIRNDFRSLWLIAATLIIFGLILGFADKYGKTERQLHQLTPMHGVLYGFAQSLALIPGVSRSGATIAMGRFMGYSREAALRYSFLLALPAVFGSGLYELKGALGGVLWVVVALLTTRRVFRVGVPRESLHPTMGNYAVACILVTAWWYLLAYVIIFISE